MGQNTDRNIRIRAAEQAGARQPFKGFDKSTHHQET